MFRRLWNFVKKVVRVTVRTFKDIVKDILDNAEATVILCAASIGVSAVASRYAMVTALPAFIDAPMVIPVLSILFITSLVLSMQWRLAI